jgi:TIR domain
MPKSSKKAVKRAPRKSLLPYTVFISHSSKDLWIAGVMAEKIRALGAKCWLDEKDLEGGNVIAEAILQGIDACREAIVLISPNSVQSQWVAFEIGAVRAQHKRVTPILNNIKPAEMAPMQDILGIDLNAFEKFLAQLGRRIKS